MPYKRLEMHVQKQIQQLKDLGHSRREVARILKIDRATVRRYWCSAGEEVKNNILTRSEWAANIDLEYIGKEIAQKVPIKILYEEQRESISLPSYQAFCQYLSRHGIGEQMTEVTMKQNRIPGDSIEVDYSGNGWSIRPEKDSIQRVQLFVAALSYSGYIFAEFTFTQRLEDFIGSHVRMFQYIGGVPQFIIPDNCKTAVVQTNKYDPVINSTYLDMCNHYGITVDPADPVSPKHKPNVERAVGIIQRDFFPRIRRKVFSSLVSLNSDLHSWLVTANKKVVKGRGQSRSFFMEKERCNFKPLPSYPYELFFFKKAKVHHDCHFHHNKNYYSVPYHYVGKEIDVKFNSKMIHVYFQCDLITSHVVCKGTYHYSTNNAHYPEKKYVDTNYYLSQIRIKSQQLGPDVYAVIERLIGESKHPLKILRKGQGIINLEKEFSRDAINHACKMALEFNCMNYDNIKRFAKNYKNPLEDILTKTPKREIQYTYYQGE